MGILKSPTQYILCVRGSKDKVLRCVDPLPKTDNGGYVDVHMHINGSYVRQTVRKDRIEKIKLKSLNGGMTV